MKRPIESDYTSHVAYTRALEAYCDSLAQDEPWTPDDMAYRPGGLSQPAQEPVAWMHEWEDGDRVPQLHPSDDRLNDQPTSVRPLVYGDTTPPQRPWVGLTDEDRKKCVNTPFVAEQWANIEAKLKEKNT